MKPTPFEMFAYLHPHEAYASNPEEFWQFFQKMNPNMTRQEMEFHLRETAEPTETIGDAMAHAVKELFKEYRL